MTLLPCPYCGNPAQHYPQSDNQSNAIYCDVCRWVLNTQVCPTKSLQQYGTGYPDGMTHRR